MIQKSTEGFQARDDSGLNQEGNGEAGEAGWIQGAF